MAISDDQNQFSGILTVIILIAIVVVASVLIDVRSNRLNLKDFYLVYQYYFDEDILKLRKEFEKNEKSIYDY